MRRAIVLLATLTLTSLNACELFTGPEPTIQLQGTVTAADDGSPIAGAEVKVTGGCIFSCTPPTYARTTTDDSGRYALSFGTEGGCKAYILTASDLIRFVSQFREGAAGVRCTDEVQTFDFQLERRT